ncbi:VOC family protein [Micromonospora sp. NPDC005324]|uniref:VOC family protein n=1 Tax=Micromonospora sp. NPDC005324 TaxID=3157033 RepID=UPI0033B7A3A3
MTAIDRSAAAFEALQATSNDLFRGAAAPPGRSGRAQIGEDAITTQDCHTIEPFLLCRVNLVFLATAVEGIYHDRIEDHAMGNGVVFFELPVDDIGAARRFYASTFGWRDTGAAPAVAPARQPGGGGERQRLVVQVSPTAVDESGMPEELGLIPGMITERTQDIRSVTIFVEVEDIDAAITSAERNGGARMIGRTSSGEHGTYAYITDPAGNVIGLWQNAIPGIRVGVRAAE